MHVQVLVSSDELKAGNSPSTWLDTGELSPLLTQVSVLQDDVCYMTRVEGDCCTFFFLQNDFHLITCESSPKSSSAL
jgi:hypothetical protein